MLFKRLINKILKKVMSAYFITLSFLFAQSNLNIIISSESELVLEINTTPLSEDDLKSFDLLIGLPNSTLPTFEIIKSNEINHLIGPRGLANSLKSLKNYPCQPY